MPKNSRRKEAAPQCHRDKCGEQDPKEATELAKDGTYIDTPIEAPAALDSPTPLGEKIKSLARAAAATWIPTKFTKNVNADLAPKTEVYWGITYCEKVGVGAKRYHCIFHDECCFHANDQSSLILSQLELPKAPTQTQQSVATEPPTPQQHLEPCASEESMAAPKKTKSKKAQKPGNKRGAPATGRTEADHSWGPQLGPTSRP
ncbi:hypothetical protein B0H17DRAFT_1149186 [Mycena rosella]|uniref:Uncharacterized protein n=1 Tax=Mycena rosella TaxID=1033263 RepID=A0AAD7C6A6_MYCRO|nr:hypothetical protein B0H17DRAFT_1149186 [Mycena rosella]